MEFNGITPGQNGKPLLDVDESQYAIKHVDINKFSVFANDKLKTGSYCPYPFNSKPYKEYWDFVDNCIINGMTVDGLSISGYHAFFLNLHPMRIVENPMSIKSAKIDAFARFWDLHYRFFHHLQKAEDQGKHFGILKPRGTGFSELFSSIGSCDFVTCPKSKSFYFASHQDYLTKDGVLTKVWDNLNFLNLETGGAYKHLRQVKDQDMHKRASYLTTKKDEKGFQSEILGRIIDHPRKVRGARTGTKGKVYFEEGGSFPHLLEAVTQTRALVEQGGVTTGQMVIWGTGGEQGPGIEGLEYIFYHGDAYNMYIVENLWDPDRIGTKSCYFFPVEEAMDKYMGRLTKEGKYVHEGICRRDEAKAHHDAERARIRKEAPTEEDRYMAEYPYTPAEALIRLVGNDFPIAELKRQLNRLHTDESIKGFIKNGFFTKDEGKIKFNLNPQAIPIISYPWNHTQKEGCVQMIESPWRDQRGLVPDGLYQIVVDPFYKDEAEFSVSLGAVFVYKYPNDVSSTEDDILVAWYIGRPRRAEVFYRNIMYMAQYYNAMVQSEMAGGGKGLFDYCRNNRLLQYCNLEPDILFHNESGMKRNKQYFKDLSADHQRLALTYQADWLLRERSLKIDPNTDETVSVINVEKIYCSYLIEEYIKFNEQGNFDGISAMNQLMFMMKDRSDVIIKPKKSKSGFWSRPKFTDHSVYHQDNTLLNASELEMNE